MKEKLKAFIKSKKGGQALFIAGIIGIVLIYVSTLIPASEENSIPDDTCKEFSEEEYITHLEQQVREIVAAISGDTSAVVTVTLDTGITYVYAEDKKENNRTEESETEVESQKNYIVVRGSDGSERPLVVTRQMPSVRGVAIVCGPVGEETQEKIKNAVMAALNITSRKIFIANKIQQ